MGIGIIGLGKLGKSLYRVISDNTNNELCYYDRTDMGDQFNFRTLKEVGKSEIIFICVDTPEDERFDGSNFYNIDNINNFDYDYGSIIEILNSLKNEDSLIVITSTVSPKYIDEIIKKFPQLNIIYNPFMFEGGNEYNSIKNQTDVILGLKKGQNSEKKLVDLYNSITSNINYHRLDYASASILKMTHNVYVSLRISFVNSIQRLTYEIGVETSPILDSLKLFPIFNKPKFMGVGLPSGGPCIPRDSLVISNSLPNDTFFKEILNERMNHVEWLTKRIIDIMNLMGKNGVSLFGLSYKKNVDNLKGSSALLLKNSLEQSGVDCVIDEESIERLTVVMNSEPELRYPYYDVWEDKIISPLK